MTQTRDHRLNDLDFPAQKSTTIPFRLFLRVLFCSAINWSLLLYPRPHRRPNRRHHHHHHHHPRHHYRGPSNGLLVDGFVGEKPGLKKINFGGCLIFDNSSVPFPVSLAPNLNWFDFFVILL